MWTRALLKQNAKASLRTSYWRIFFICLVGTLLAGDLVDRGSRAVSPSYSAQDGFYVSFTQNGVSSFLQSLQVLGAVIAIVVVLAVVLAVVALALGWNIFVAPVIRVGWCRAMMENRVGKPPFETLFSGFSREYWSLVKGQFYANLRIFLYTLLLVIPGVIKSYEYTFVPYLLAENPALSPARAAELSSQMTSGEKWNIFKLQLSFLGWYILGAIAFGIGRFFVDPYYEATMAELYAAMRAKAFANGYTDSQELGDFVRY
jgi:hypothetical protein